MSSESLQSLSPSDKRALLARLLAEEACGPVRFPLSASQQRLWFLDQLDPGRAAYNLRFACGLRGALNWQALAASVQEIVRRHGSLRTAFETVDHQPVQVVSPAGAACVSLADLRGLAAPARRREAERLRTAVCGLPFDLRQGPLLRVHLFCLAPEEWELAIALHHIIGDGWSVAVFVRELAALYEATVSGRPSPLPELPLQYADFVLQQARQLQNGLLEGQLAYWRERLGDGPAVLDLPTDRPRPAVRTARGGSRAALLPPALQEALAAVGRQEKTTLFMVLLAGFQGVLHRCTGQPDIAVGSPITGRNRLRLEGLIGLFVNTLVLRTDLGGDPTWRELLGRVRSVTLGAFAHQELPFDRLIEELKIERDLSRTPLFQVMLAFQDAPLVAPNLAGGALDLLPVEATAAKFDLNFEVTAGASGLLICAEYDRDLFEPATVTRLLGHFRTFLDSASRQPDARLSSLPLLSAGERHQLLAEWNDRATRFAGELCVHRSIERQAGLSPEAVAVVCEGTALSYGELDSRSNRLGRRLRRLGVGPEVVVGICAERSVELLVALLGILKAGGAYLPLDPSYPPERLSFMVEDGLAGSGRPVLLVERRLAAVFTAWSIASGALQVELDGLRELSGESDAALESGVGPENLAYVIYTSGSTGRPKGVQIRHGALANFLSTMLERTGITRSDTLLATTTLSFDIAGLELYLPLVSGARVVLVPQEVSRDGEQLAARLTDSWATFMQGTPATWQLLLGAGWRRKSRLKILCGGEALPGDLAERLLAATSSLWNVYGPTETTIWSTLSELHEGERISIGRPLANTEVYLLSRQLTPVAQGSLGELYIGGVGVARGYGGRPDLTAERFIPDPFVERPGARLYRTGDLGRWRPDGSLDFLGRVDNQVKVRGFRIELGEIASVLLDHPGVREAVVVAREYRPGDRRLIAYLVPVERRLTSEELRGLLRTRLPEYMVPSSFSWLEALPLTPAGKVDRRALPWPEERAGAGAGESEGARNPFEDLLAGIWAEALKVERVGIEDNFFDLGGHSLLATRVVSRIREVFGVTLPVRTLFNRPTVSRLAEAVVEGLKAGEVSTAPPLSPVARGGPLPLSFAQQRLWFLDQLDPGSAAYNIPFAVRIEGRLAPGVLSAALAQVVERHEALRTSFGVVGSEPVQVIASGAGARLLMVDLAALPGPWRGAQVRELAAREATTPFNLARGPLLRLTLLRLDDDEHVLLLTVHHIAADGESAAMLVDEASALYLALSRGEPSPLPALPVQYADYAHWQRRWLQSEVLAERLLYWRRQLAGEWSSGLLPVDHPPPARRSHRGTHHPFRLSSSLVTAVRAICRREMATPFMFLLSSFAVLLSHRAARREVIVGVDLASRTPETEGLIGHFVNMLPMRADLSGNPRFLELLRRVRQASLDAIQQELPFERLVEELQPERTADGSSLLEVVFNFTSARRKNAADRLLDAAGLKLSLVEREDRLVRFDLMLVMNESKDAMSGAWIYSTELFAPATVSSLHEEFMALLDRVVERPEATLSELTAQGSALRDGQEEARHELNRRRLRAIEPKPVRL